MSLFLPVLAAVSGEEANLFTGDGKRKGFFVFFCISVSFY